MSVASVLWSPTAWLNSAHVEHWLRGVWPSWRMDDVRHEWDSDDHWYWIIPDFDHGRSRVLGISRLLLERTTVSKLRQVLDDCGWRTRIEKEPLLVQRSEQGDWTAVDWHPQVQEKWFQDPQGGFFVAFRDMNAMISSAPPPARLPSPSLALHGKTWSAMGPKDPRPVDDYELEDLLPFLPEGRHAAL